MKNKKRTKTTKEVQEVTENAKQEVKVSQEENIIYIFPKNKLDDIKCKVFNYKGRRCLAMTVFEMGFDGKKYPQDSICIALETWQKYLPDLAKVVQDAH